MVSFVSSLFPSGLPSTNLANASWTQPEFSRQAQVGFAGQIPFVNLAISIFSIRNLALLSIKFGALLFRPDFVNFLSGLPIPDTDDVAAVNERAYVVGTILEIDYVPK